MLRGADRPPSLLIVSAFFSPEVAGNGPYVADFVGFLHAEGHRVTVLTGHPHFPQWKRAPDGPDPAGIRVLRRWHLVPKTPTFARRATYEASLLLTGLASLLRIRRPDVIVVYSSNLSDLLVAGAAAVVFRRPYVVVVQDLVGPALRQTRMARFGWIAGAVSRTELAVIRGARRVGIIAETFRPHLSAGGVRPSRIMRVRNWPRVEPAAARPLPEGNTVLKCVHAGNMGAKQGLNVVLQAAALLQGEQVEFVLAGDGGERPALVARAAELSLGNVTFRPPLSSADYAELLGSADVLLLSQLPDVTDMAFPSKLASYLSAGRPVIAAVSDASEAAHELCAAEAGLIVTPGDPEALAAAVMRMRGDMEARRRFAANASTFAAKMLAKEECLRGMRSLVMLGAARTLRAANAPKEEGTR